jgi:hypothetical protein
MNGGTQSSTTPRRAAARKPTAVDKNAGRQSATRIANMNAGRGIQTSNKPSAKEIVREVNSQFERREAATRPSPQTPRNRQKVVAQAKSRKQKKE